jgi:hypothetical protein
MTVTELRAGARSTEGSGNASRLIAANTSTVIASAATAARLNLVKNMRLNNDIGEPGA